MEPISHSHIGKSEGETLRKDLKLKLLKLLSQRFTLRETC